MKQARYYAVCEIHGSVTKKASGRQKVVAVSPPKGRKQRQDGGCPMCKRPI